MEEQKSQGDHIIENNEEKPKRPRKLIQASDFTGYSQSNAS